MEDVDKHLQCQECLLTFKTDEALRHHIEKFRDLSNRIRTWEEQCRAHIEPVIELDDEPDELDVELCRDHPALMGARVCPVEACGKRFNEKKQLNIHFESHDDCLLNEACLVCDYKSTHIRKFLAHTIHPEAIKRHRDYILKARIELREEARKKLHQMLIEASARVEPATKRKPGEANLDHNSPIKRIRLLHTDNKIEAMNSAEELNVEAIGAFSKSVSDASSFAQSVPPDPYAAPMFPSGNGCLDFIGDPYAAPLYQHQDDCQAHIGIEDGFLPFSNQAPDALHGVSWR